MLFKDVGKVRDLIICLDFQMVKWCASEIR